MTPYDIYHETCSMMRHYSNSSLTIRMAAIVQGLFVLSASGYLYRSGDNYAAVVSSVFGILLTFVLHVLHGNYQHKCEVFINIACTIEQKIDEPLIRAFEIAKSGHTKRYRNLFGEVFVINGFFIFMDFSFFLLIFIIIFV